MRKRVNRGEVEDERNPGRELEEFGHEFHCTGSTPKDGRRIAEALPLILDHPAGSPRAGFELCVGSRTEPYSIAARGRRYPRKRLDQPGGIY
jgi:hypothetical protein